MKREIPGAAYSLFDKLYLERLPNWGRWGRQDSCKPDPNHGSSSIYEQGKPSEDGDEGWGSETVGDAIVPIDVRDAEEMDCWIRQLAGHHRTVIRWVWYRRDNKVRPTKLTVDAAVRAIVDLMNDNRATVKRMRDLGR